MFDAMGRLIQIAVLASEYANDIREIALSAGREEMCRDLRGLEESLKHASSFFERSREQVQKLYVAVQPDSREVP
jgi:hypothetical protein